MAGKLAESNLITIRDMNMTAKIIAGTQVVAAIRAELKAEVQKLKDRGVTPGLGVILVGDAPAFKSVGRLSSVRSVICRLPSVFPADHAFRLAASLIRFMPMTSR